MADLTEYVDAAARAMYADYCPGRDFDALTTLEQLAFRESVTPIVAAVAPLIERDSRVAALEEAAEAVAGLHGWDVLAWLRDRAKRIREGR